MTSTFLSRLSGSCSLPIKFRLLLSVLSGFVVFLICKAGGYFYQFTSQVSQQQVFFSLLFAITAVIGTWLLLTACKGGWELSLLLLAGCITAMCLRLCFIENITQDYDYFLSSWVDLYRQGGGYAVFHETIGNYNVPYLYFLAAFSYLPFSDFYCIKLLSIFFDFLLVYGVVQVVSIFDPSSGKKNDCSASNAALPHLFSQQRLVGSMRQYLCLSSIAFLCCASTWKRKSWTCLCCAFSFF